MRLMDLADYTGEDGIIIEVDGDNKSLMVVDEVSCVVCQPFSWLEPSENPDALFIVQTTG
jgi:hypothetical protein